MATIEAPLDAANGPANTLRGESAISQLASEDSLELHFDDPRHFTTLVGQHDAHIRTIEHALGVRIGANGTVLKITGGHAQQALAGKLLSELYEMLKRGYPIYPSDVEYSIRILRGDRNVDLKDIFLDTVYVSAHKRVISPKSVHQKLYIEAIRKHDIVFGIGPAGTGKTYLAMAMALAALMKNQVTRMVLCRPAVEAGERLGFLPGDLAEKVNPYLRPLYDALHDMVDFDRARRMLERGTIEVAPLAFMRGRTLNDSFIILDEAQNTTSEQMKMFLTRLGYNSQGRNHRRYHPDRSAERQALGTQGSTHGARQHAGYLLRAFRSARRGAPSPGPGGHHRLRIGQRRAAPDEYRRRRPVRGLGPRGRAVAVETSSGGGRNQMRCHAGAALCARLAVRCRETDAGARARRLRAFPADRRRSRDAQPQSPFPGEGPADRRALIRANRGAS